MPLNSENKEKIELYLSMGATRWEACRPIAIEAMRRAMLPTINQMRYGLFLLLSFNIFAYTPLMNVDKKMMHCFGPLLTQCQQFFPIN